MSSGSASRRRHAPAADAAALLDVVDASGSVVWSHPFGTKWYELAVNEPAIDDTGHLFVNFNPGRYNGVIVLAPIEDGFEDFGTLPDYGDYNTRFYYAEAVDPDEDGTLEVEVSENDCIPSCADGSITSTLYTWDGEDSDWIARLRDAVAAVREARESGPQ